MAADRAGRRTGRIQQDGVGRAGRAAIGWRRRSRSWRSGRAASGCACSRSSRLAERSTAITSAPAAASCAVLPPGAAQRSMTRLPPTSPSRRAGQCGRRVLHPPGALGESGQRFDRSGRAAAQGAGRQDRRPPAVRAQSAASALDREIERRFPQMGLRRSRRRASRRRSLTQRLPQPGGVLSDGRPSVPASSAAFARPIRRSMALISALKPAVSAAARGDRRPLVSTAAWGGVSRNSS